MYAQWDDCLNLKNKISIHIYNFFFSYSFFHATRKTFSNVKTTISKEWSPTFHNVTVNETKPDKVNKIFTMIIEGYIWQQTQ
jgi:hypothetical protein